LDSGFVKATSTPIAITGIDNQKLMLNNETKDQNKKGGHCKLINQKAII